MGKQYQAGPANLEPDDFFLDDEETTNQLFADDDPLTDQFFSDDDEALERFFSDDDTALIEAMSQQTNLTVPQEDTPPPPLPRRQQKSLVQVGVAVGLLVLLAGSALSTWKFMIKPGMVPDVQLYTASMQSVTQAIGGGGIVYAQQQLTVSYPTAERVLAVEVTPGQQVSPNQPLLQLDPAQIDAQLKQAQDKVSAAQAYLNTVSYSGTAIQIAGAQQQYNNALSAYNALLAETNAPSFHNGTLVSPIKGIITTINVTQGQMFQPNATLLTILNESTVIVHAKMPLSYLGQIRVGQKASVTPSALSSQTLQGVVSAVIPQADPQTDTFEVWVTVNNTTATLVSGMTAFVRIQDQEKALVVPRLAILDLDSNPQVFVIDANSHVHLRTVHIIGRTPTDIFIDSGIAANERVVLVGLMNLHDGQLVNIVSHKN